MNITCKRCRVRMAARLFEPGSSRCKACSKAAQKKRKRQTRFSVSLSRGYRRKLDRLAIRNGLPLAAVVEALSDHALEALRDAS